MMLERPQSFVAPAYLFACLILGGSAQGIWANMVLQLSGAAIIAWAAVHGGDGQRLAPAARYLLLLLISGIAVVAVQLIPLPPTVWPHVGPRNMIADGFTVLGMSVPAEPLSLAPASTLSSLLAIIPPLAIFCAMVRLKAYRRPWLAAALVAGTLAGIALGAMQVATSHGSLSPWNLYDETNFGRAVGFFANRDHMATLMIVTIPFLAALVASRKGSSRQRHSALIAAAGGAMIVILVGLALNGSLAGYGLALPVLGASALIILPQRSRLRPWIVGGVALLLVGSMAAIEMGPVGAGRIGEHASSAVQSRTELLSTTSRATRDFMPFGSGLGSFRSVYQLYEQPNQVTNIFVIHAHNDYAELALELGIAGVVVMLLFLMWWIVRAWRAWRTVEGGPFARAAAVGSAAILLHSLVDFPLRTAAIAACFAMCAALLADSRAAPPREARQLRGGRHITI
jgi:O-antigen ligase